MSDVLHHRARIGALSRSRPVDDPELVEAKLKLRVERLAEHVKKAVEASPPLTEEQIDRIAAILRAGAA